MKTIKEIIIVAGLGRCGSSLTMQMLQAGGIECTGQYPSFEDNRCDIFTQNPTWLTSQQGKASKILLPYLFKFKPANYKFIWLDRKPIHQATSTIKFSHYTGIQPYGTHKQVSHNIRKMALAYPKDRKRAFKTMEKFGPILTLDFENLVLFPKSSVSLIEAFLGRDLDSANMASVVLPRSIDPKPNMDIEIQLMEL